MTLSLISLGCMLSPATVDFIYLDLFSNSGLDMGLVDMSGSTAPKPAMPRGVRVVIGAFQNKYSYYV